MKRLPAALLALAPLAGIAGPFDQPWVVVTSESRPSSDPKVRPVIVNRVDGVNAARNRVVAGPGTLRVTVDLPPRKGFSLGTQETFELVASPCMRYDVAARLDTETGQRWTPFVRSAESIGECLAKFKGGTVPK